MLAGVLGQQPQANRNARDRGDDEFRALVKFQKNNPLSFDGGYEPDKALLWMKSMEKIFRVMGRSDAQQVQFGTHMLEKEAEDWWNGTSQRLGEGGTAMTWTSFKKAFLDRYFPEDVRGS